MEGKELTSDDYLDLATIIAVKAHDIVKERSMVPPLVIHATDADDDTIVHSVCDENGVRPIFAVDRRLTARFPITVTIADRRGIDQVEITIDEELLRQFRRTI